MLKNHFKNIVNPLNIQLQSYLHPFLAADSDSDVSRFDHGYIIGSIADG